MRIVAMKQGSKEWLEHRRNYFNASDSPAMMGCSPYKTRDQLVHELATGIGEDITPQKQRIFDAGHHAEKLARPLAEQIIGESLFPVTAVADVGPYSASMDGLTMGEDVAFEHKALNDVLREAMVPGCTGADLPIAYLVQMEHQCMVADTVERTLFMASKWQFDAFTSRDELVEERHCWYTPDAALRAAIVEGWKQLERDVAAYNPAKDQPAPKVEAKVKDAKLPALRIEVRGEVLASNVEDLRALAVGRITLVKTELKVDQDFADARVDAAWLREVSESMKLGVQMVRGGMETVDALLTMLEEVEALATRKAIDLEKLVETEGKRRKEAVVIKAQGDLDEHIKKHNEVLGGMYLQRVVGPLAEAAKRLQTIKSTEEKVGAALAAEKAKADALALNFTRNRAHLKQGEVDWITVFPDFASQGGQDSEVFQAIAKQRIDRANEASETARKAREAAAAPAPVAAPAPAPIVAHAPARAKCDGNHGGPTCADPECWNAGNVVDAEWPGAVTVCAAVVADDGRRINIGQIKEAIAPLSIDAAGLADLGWPVVETIKGSKMYREVDLPQMIASMMGQLRAAHQRASDTAAAAQGSPF